MRVGIITYHNSLSYGACLQALATQRIFEYLGCSAQIINYHNPYEQQNKKFIYSVDGSLKGYVGSGIRSLLLHRHSLMLKAFGSFHKIYNMTDMAYTSVRDMQQLDYDVLVVGSDQVWNPKISHGLDQAFLLDFGRAQKRISFASSMGSAKLTGEQKADFIKKLNRFDSISARERITAEMLEAWLGREVKTIIDPSMFLSANEWREETKDRACYISADNKYILTYLISAPYSAFSDTISFYSRKTGLPVWNIQTSAYRWKGPNRAVIGATPEDFVALIDHAALVITDSFHGAVFSILFQKDLIAIKNSGNPGRTEQLLEQFGMTCRMNPDRTCQLPAFDYRNVMTKLDALRSDGYAWVKHAIDA